MPDLLLEILSEEIPARMQPAAAGELERLVVGGLSDRGLLFGSARAFAGPRRLALAIAGLPAAQPDVSEERKGPRVDAAEKAVQGFLRSAGVALDACVKRGDAKGEFYVAVIKRAGRAIEEVLSELLPGCLAKLVWPKSMRWNAGTVRWVRPLHGIVCTCDGEVVPFEFAGVRSGNATRGHRFLADGIIEVRRFEDYEKKLADAFVVLDAAQRKEIVLHEATQKAFALGLKPIEDKALLDEIAGLVEWPVVLMGTIEETFMQLPAEVLRASMRLHQKFLALGQAGTGSLSNKFLVVANIEADDGGRDIVAGNERVLRARLSDARFFWDLDRSRTLSSRLPALKDIVFHARAGSMGDRARRMEAVAMVLAAVLGFDAAKCGRAARLAKADLTTGMVGEFPELQGTMGYHYARHDNEDETVALAIRDHYKPQGPADGVPEQPVSIAVALADKLDSLVMLWRAGEKPTGSKDPFALRRAALGIIRIVLENRLRLPLAEAMFAVIAAARDEGSGPRRGEQAIGNPLEPGSRADREVAAELLRFFGERLKFALRDRGVRHDLIDAVLSLGAEDDLVRLVARVDALDEFLRSSDGANLLAAYRRAVNILKIEEKRDGRSYDGEPASDLVQVAEEDRMLSALAAAEEPISVYLKEERFAQAMTVMAGLRAPVDAFFEHVTVNVADAALRHNRLLLLSRLRRVLLGVADFSRLEG